MRLRQRSLTVTGRVVERSMLTMIVRAEHFTRPVLLTMRWSSTIELSAMLVMAVSTSRRSSIFCRLDEIAIDVGHYGGGWFAAECVGHKLPEIGVLAHVEELQVYAVVEVAEHVDVVETYLYRQAVAKVDFG